jgi:protein-S-isoprenylcysteine O-methyltransferase Ste14
MGMPILGLALLGLYGLLAVGIRMAVQVSRTGSTGFKGLRTDSGSVERAAGGLLAMSAVLILAGPILELAGALDPIRVLDGALADILGAALATVGIGITTIAQFVMGDAWRIGVDSAERTALVTDGPFRVVRNPIYAAMIPAFMGIALLAPNVVTIAGAILLIIALQLQTRLIEEPYLLAVHGEQYAAYAAQVGRFIPGVGRPRPKGEQLSGP